MVYILGKIIQHISNVCCLSDPSGFKLAAISKQKMPFGRFISVWQLFPVWSSPSQVQKQVVFFILRNDKPWWHWYLLKSQGNATVLNCPVGASLFNIWKTCFSISDTFLCQYYCLGSQMLVFKALFGSVTGKQRVRGFWSGRLLEYPALRRQLSSGGCSAPASPGWCWMNTGKVCFSTHAFLPDTSSPYMGHGYQWSQWVPGGPWDV